MQAVVQLVLPVAQVHEPLPVHMNPVRHAAWFCQVPVESQSCGKPVLPQLRSPGLQVPVQPPVAVTEQALLVQVLGLGRPHVPALQVPAPW